jgi:uncharacterized protein YjiS (DUF1127 family)
MPIKGLLGPWRKVMFRLGFIDFVARKMKARRIYTQVIDELSIYSERELADIGLRAADLRRVARDSARRVEMRP